MTTTSKVRFGIVGAGWVAGDRYAPNLASLANTHLVAVYDPTLERAEALADRFPGTAATADWAQFLSLDLDAVAICSSPWSHPSLAIEALEAGRHVLCEKPMAIQVEDARAMVKAAEDANLGLSISHNFLFSRAMQQADRYLGPNPDLAYAAGIQLSSPRRRLPTWYERLPAGLMVDESPHMLYSLRHLLGRLSLEHVRATWATHASTPSTVEVLLSGERGPGQLTMVFDSPVSEWQVMAADGRQVVALDFFRDITMRIPADGAHKASDIMRTSGAAIGTHVRGFVQSGARFVAGRQSWGHRELISQFADAVLGRGAVPVPPSESVEIVALTNDILDAMGPRARISST